MTYESYLTIHNLKHDQHLKQYKHDVFTQTEIITIFDEISHDTFMNKKYLQLNIKKCVE